MTFNDLNLIKPILDSLIQEGYTQPTPIQQQAIPVVLQGRDLLGCAQTGTGKTAAFAIPILQLLHGRSHKGPRKIRTLILTPTRELAIQIDESFAAYGRHLNLHHMAIFGGVPQGPQTKLLGAGMDILIATPGRLLDLMQQRFISLQDLEIFVLDEADRMLDMGFIHDVKKVVAKLPHKRQTLFFSATMPPEIQKLANTILSEPEEVKVTPVSSTAETIRQSIYMTNKQDKRKLLAYILKDPRIERVLVFTRTKHGADKLVKELQKLSIHAGAIHGNKSQNARQRVLKEFKANELRVLIATDIAARGIDIDELPQVINYDLPEVPETYVHRIGRTGRAGASGMAISFCDEEELDNLKGIQKLINKQIPVAADNPFPMEGAGPKITPPKNKDIVQRPDAVYEQSKPKRHFHKHKKPGGQSGQTSAKKNKPGTF